MSGWESWFVAGTLPQWILGDEKQAGINTANAMAGAQSEVMKQ
jgi:hypothetical protein